MTASEKKLANEVKNRISESHVLLIMGEAVTITLFAQSHIKIKQSQEDAIKSAHEYLASWESDAARMQIAEDILRNNPIRQNALIILRISDGIGPQPNALRNS